MKQFFLCLLLASGTAALHAQVAVQAHQHDQSPYHEVDLTDNHFIKNLPEPIASDVRSSGAISFSMIGTAYNAFTILTTGQNQVDYNPDINTVTFLHRHNNGTTGGSGGLSFDVSTDGGDSWPDINVALSPNYNAGSETMNGGNRYPSGAIYNPLGNTDPNNAYMVGVGPSLLMSAAGWGYHFQVSARIPDGANVDENYVYTYGDDYFPYGLTQNADGSMWYLLPKFLDDDASDPARDYNAFIVYKGIFNTGTNAIDWAPMDTISPNFRVADYFATAGLENCATGSAHNLEFSPDGMTGYITIMGSTVTAPVNGPAPLVYKTTDGGDTWNALPDYDFAAMPSIATHIAPLGPPNLPYFADYDITVDDNGTLHMFNEIAPRFSGAADSAFFTSIPAGGDGSFNGLFHLYTTDGTDWVANRVDSIEVSDGEIPLAGSTPVAVTVQPQVARSIDGSKIFFSWSHTDPELLLTNDLPNLYIRGYDTDDDEYTFIRIPTAGTAVDNTIFWPTTAPTVIESGSEHDFQYATVFCQPDASDAGSPVQFFYIGGAGFDDGDFGLASPPATADFSFSGTPDNIVSFTNLSADADTYVWDFGDGTALSSLTNPTHTYTTVGTYNVCLTAKNDGTPATDDTFCDDVEVTNIVNGIGDPALDAALELFPNPSNGVVNITAEGYSNLTVEVFNLLGETMTPATVFNGTMQLDLSNMSNGTYLVKVTSEAGVSTRSVSISR